MATSKLTSTALQFSANGLFAEESLTDIAAGFTFTTNSEGVPSEIRVMGPLPIKINTPQADDHAATKSYVDGLAQGLQVGAAVKAVTTANSGLSGVGDIDG